jgi:hypothetical protein
VGLGGNDGGPGQIFDFLDAPSFGGGGKDGAVVLADKNNWPGVIGNNIAFLMTFLGPCGMIPPHLHPRASEVYLNIAGPPLISTIITGGADGPINNILGPGNITVLPMGSLHMIASTGCDPTLFVAAFNNEDPGALFLTTAYQAFDPETIDAAFGHVGAKVYNDSMIPISAIIGRDECLSRCNIDKNTFNIQSTSKKDLMIQAMSAWVKTQGA